MYLPAAFSGCLTLLYISVALFDSAPVCYSFDRSATVYINSRTYCNIFDCAFEVCVMQCMWFLCTGTRNINVTRFHPLVSSNEVQFSPRFSLKQVFLYSIRLHSDICQKHDKRNSCTVRYCNSHFLHLRMYLLVIFAALVSSLSAEFKPECWMNPSQIAAKNGYDLFSHWVTTPDGYILQLHHIPSSKSGAEVVFLQHGLLDSSMTWILNGKSG